MLKLAPTIFGLVLIALRAALTLKRPKLGNPSASLQQSLVAVIEDASIRTALLTAGLISVAFGLA